MKKNNFIEGAMIATIGIVLCKILGLIYVIPFYDIIGTKGGALYSYAYSIYSIFLSLSICGIPTAISKVVSEYSELGFLKTKEKIYHIASKLITIIGFVGFIILIIFAPLISKLIIGDLQGGNSIEEITIAIRIVALALLIVPRMSILRGYFQGHKFITTTSISEVIEQFIRVVVIVGGSFITVRVLKLPIEYAVYIAIFGASVGAIISYIFLKLKQKKFPVEKKAELLDEEKKITTAHLLKQIIFYAIPFVIIDLLKSAYAIVDSVTVVKGLVNLGYTISDAETALGVMATWGTKLNMIIVSISLGFTISLVPNIAGDAVKKEYKSINNKINQTIKMLLYMTLPMAFGISFLASSVWIVFYGYDALSIEIFKFFILQVVFFSLYTTAINIAQSMSETKIALGTLIGSFIAKAVLNIPMMNVFKYIGIDAYLAPTFVNAIVEFTAFIIVLLMLKKKYSFNYKTILNSLWKIILSLSSMLLVLNLVSHLININNSSRLLSLLNIIIHTVIGASVYFYITNKFNLINDIFGKEFIKKIYKKLSKKNRKK